MEAECVYPLVLPSGGDQAYRRQEMGTYISDITRTWPINGKFSDPQRDLYNAVLNANRSCVSLCRESAGISLDRLHGIAENALKDQLKQLGFDVSGDVSAIYFPCEWD